MLGALVLAAVLQERVACRVDPSQTYTLILPAGYDAAKKYPLLLVLDPRGRGTPAAELFRAAADERGWIIVSSNDTRSDGPAEPNERALQALYPEVLRRYGADPRRLYAAGFSGTAVVAWSFAVRSGAVAGVISAGGRLIDELPPAKFTFANYSFAGEADFNNREMRAVDALITAPHRFTPFDGGHRWMPAELARDALAWFDILAMKTGRVPLDGPFVDAEYARELTAAAALSPRDALRRYRAIVETYDGLRPVGEAKAELSRLEKDPFVRRELAEERKWDGFEARFLAQVFANFGAVVAESRGHGQRNLVNRFLREFRVAELEKRATRPGAEGRTAKRLLAAVHVQAAFYLPRMFEARGNQELAEAMRALAAEMRVK